MIKGINHITLAVTDIARSFAFYKDILGLKPLVKWDQGAYFMVGDIWFCLNVDENRVPNSCYTHYAFTVAQEDFEKLSEKITKHAQIFKNNTSPGESLYFLDPDGHKLEIHVGNVKSRIRAKKQNLGSWQNVEWFV
ncbi:MAG: glutathione transferase [Alphaproteobacteria bacterium 33-17]|nr:MAG: glutathione transferase [Alphaproteobacteria bacterium 33-17]